MSGALGPGPLTEEALRTHIHPQFSRVMARPEIYLANHSLGRPPDRAQHDVMAALGQWYDELDGAWMAWMDGREKFRQLVAGLIGATRPDSVIPRANAGQGLRAVLNAADGPQRVLTTRGEFDSLDFILKVYADRGRIQLDFVSPGPDGTFQIADLVAALRPDTGLVVVSQVMFATGQVLGDLRPLIAAAHAVGARVLVDTYHAAGALPVDVQALGCDYAVGGCYKYLRGCAGAGWLYIRPDLLDGGLTTLDTGWFAKRDPFGYERPDRPAFAAGGDAFLESTPAVLPWFQALAGLEMTADLGPARLRAYSLQQQRELVAALREHGIAADGGREDHGAFVTVRHPEAVSLAERLKTEGVNTDARGDVLRLCPDILNTSEELIAAAARLAGVVARTARPQQIG